jgi:hypothetical protein
MTNRNATATLKPINFEWYPTLRAKWAGTVTVLGPYLAGTANQVVIRNELGDEMAVQEKNITYLNQAQ